MPALQVSSLSLIAIIPFTAAYSWHLDVASVITEHDEGLMALLYISLLALFSTAIGLILFNKLIQEESALFASSVTYFIPIAAIGWGLLDGESVSPIQVGCIGLILLGVWYVNRAKRAVK